MSILNNLKRPFYRRKSIDQILYEKHGYKVRLRTTRAVMKQFKSADLEEMGKLVLGEFLSDFEMDRIAERLKIRFDLNDLEAAVVKDTENEILIFIL